MKTRYTAIFNPGGRYGSRVVEFSPSGCDLGLPTLQAMAEDIWRDKPCVTVIDHYTGNAYGFSHGVHIWTESDK